MYQIERSAQEWQAAIDALFATGRAWDRTLAGWIIGALTTQPGMERVTVLMTAPQIAQLRGVELEEATA